MFSYVLSDVFTVIGFPSAYNCSSCFFTLAMRELPPPRRPRHVTGIPETNSDIASSFDLRMIVSDTVYPVSIGYSGTSASAVSSNVISASNSVPAILTGVNACGIPSPPYAYVSALASSAVASAAPRFIVLAVFSCAALSP